MRSDGAQLGNEIVEHFVVVRHVDSSQQGSSGNGIAGLTLLTVRHELHDPVEHIGEHAGAEVVHLRLHRPDDVVVALDPLFHSDPTPAG